MSFTCTRACERFHGNKRQGQRERGGERSRDRQGLRERGGETGTEGERW
jgi:hypothetical protein